MPNYDHDCNDCKHLGSDDVYDYYLCSKGFIKPGNLVARQSSFPPDYTSYPASVVKNVISHGPMNAAFILAKDQGLI